MVCKNCGQNIPDGSNTCPSCGAAQNAAPAQNAAQNFGNAVNSGISSIDKNLPTVNIAGRTVKLSVMSLAPALMILFLIIGMIGVFSFNTAKVKMKITAGSYGSASHTERYSLSDLDSDSLDEMDAGFTKFIKVVNVIAIIASIGALGLCGYMTYKNDTVKAVLAVGLSGAILALAYLLDIINGFYIKGKFKDMSEGLYKVSGGASFGGIFWFIIMGAIAFGAYTISNKVKASQSAKV